MQARAAPMPALQAAPFRFEMASAAAAMKSRWKHKMLAPPGLSARSSVWSATSEEGEGRVSVEEAPPQVPNETWVDDKETTKNQKEVAEVPDEKVAQQQVADDKVPEKEEVGEKQVTDKVDRTDATWDHYKATDSTDASWKTGKWKNQKGSDWQKGWQETQWQQNKWQYQGKGWTEETWTSDTKSDAGRQMASVAASSTDNPWQAADGSQSNQYGCDDKSDAGSQMMANAASSSTDSPLDGLSIRKRNKQKIKEEAMALLARLK